MSDEQQKVEEQSTTERVEGEDGTVVERTETSRTEESPAESGSDDNSDANEEG